MAKYPKRIDPAKAANEKRARDFLARQRKAAQITAGIMAKAAKLPRQPKGPKTPRVVAAGGMVGGSTPRPRPFGPARAPRPNLGEAQPTAVTRPKVQASFLAKLLGFTETAEKRRLKAEKERRRIREELGGKVGAVRRTILHLRLGVAGAFAGARSALERLRTTVAGPALFETPVAALRQRPSWAQWNTAEDGTPMKGVSSSNVYSFSFSDPDNDGRGTLTVQFRGAASVYEYYDCPKWIADGLSNARSPGRYVWDLLRPLYDGTAMYRRVA